MMEKELIELKNKIKNMLENEETMTLIEINKFVNELRKKYNVLIDMIKTESGDLKGFAVMDTNEKLIFGILAKAGREEVKKEFRKEIKEKINKFNSKGKITEKGINKFIKEIYQEYPISELLFKLEDDKLVLTTLEFDY